MMPWMQNKVNPMSPLAGDQIIVTQGYLGKMSLGHWGWIHIVLIRTDPAYWCSVISETRKNSLNKNNCRDYISINGLRNVNKANVRDLIAVTSLVILLKLDSNRWPMWPWIWWMTSKNNRAPFLYYFKLCASSQSYWWTETKVAVPKRPFRVKIGNFLSRVTLKLDVWHWKTIAQGWSNVHFIDWFLMIFRTKKWF